MSRPRVFLSYSHRDTDWLDRLVPHLEVLKKGCDIDIWSDKRIAVGTRWLDEIDAAIASSRIAVLLLSEHYLASEFITSAEIPRLMARAQQQGLQLVVLVLRPCLVELHEDLSSLQFLNPPSHTLEEMTPAEQSRTLLLLAKEIRAASTAPTPPAPAGKPKAPSGEPQRRVVLEHESPAVGLQGRLVQGIGIETCGGVFTPLLKVGAAVPAQVLETFSTASDGQASITLRFFRGVGTQVLDCTPLGEYVIQGLPAVRRGVPQIGLRVSVSGRAIVAEVVGQPPPYALLSIQPATGA